MRFIFNMACALGIMALGLMALWACFVLYVVFFSPGGHTPSKSIQQKMESGNCSYKEVGPSTDGVRFVEPILVCKERK